MAEGGDVSGVVVVDKAPGLTSHQVVGRLRRLLGTRKVGHAGTLDPMATGVLVCGVNRATRLLGHLMVGTKSYRATIRLGSTTVTDDAEGEILTTPGAERIEPEQAHQLFARFTGDIEQVPTQVSAIKVDGVRSYARVRSGEQVDLPARPVTVHRFDLGSSALYGEHLDLEVEVDCSAGTYIRALARDLGRELGCGGHLTALRRTAVGPYGLDRAVRIDLDDTAPTVIDIDRVARENFTAVQLDPEEAARVRHGGRIDPSRLAPAGLSALFDDEQFLALHRGDGSVEAVFAPAGART